MNLKLSIEKAKQKAKELYFGSEVKEQWTPGGPRPYVDADVDAVVQWACEDILLNRAKEDISETDYEMAVCAVTNYVNAHAGEWEEAIIEIERMGREDDREMKRLKQASYNY